MENRPYTVYVITCLATSKAYVGATRMPLWKRWRAHQDRAKDGSDMLISQAIRQHGKAAFSIRRLVITTQDDAFRIERALIAAWGTLHPGGYNLAPGGLGNRGITRSPETIAKMLATRERLGKTRKGIKHTPAALEKMRLAAKERGVAHLLTPESIAKRAATQSQRNKGKKHSTETREKMSRARKGKPKSEAHKAAISLGLLKAHRGQ